MLYKGEKNMLLESIKTRRSTRKFTDKNVTKEEIEILLEAAMLAPSGCNTRPWRFIVIKNRDLMEQIADVHGYANMMKTAPVCIAVIALPKAQEGHKDDLPKGFYPQDCAAATQNILIQAEALGLGSCWCGVYPRDTTIEAIRNVLQVPDDEIPFCLIAIGEKDEFPKPRGRFEPEKVSWVM